MSSQPYHHGDLRDALIAAALTIVERDGAATLSLRGAARAAGVSATAPYHHFRDRAALVAAVATAGFERLQAGKVAALASGADPASQLVAGARHYVEFILDNPGLYRLMKSAELADRAAHPELETAAAAPAATLAGLVGQLASRGALGATDPATVARSAWALAHGIGMLALDAYLGDRASVLALTEAAARALVAGYAVTG